MQNTIVLINNKKLNYFEIGNGFPIVFLHGYLESNEIWTEFAIKLSEYYRVICPDLPGQGKSEHLNNQTVELMADSVNELLNNLKVKKCIMFGHSMGGYVSLAFAKKYNKVLSGLCLFHSHPFPDDNEKIKNRLQEIELLQKGKKDLIITTSIPKMYAKKFIEKNEKYLKKSLSIALKTELNGMIACINAMINRYDHTQTLKNIDLPTMWIGGQYDNFFDYKLLNNFNNTNITVSLLKNSGHMGMYEEPEISFKVVSKFIKNCIV